MKKRGILFLWYFFSLSAISIDDIHKLNKTNIVRLFEPKTSNELPFILEYARKQGLNVSVCAKRHSQGGQPFCKDGIVIDITSLNRVLHVDCIRKTITVEPGIDWKRIQELINPYGLSLRTMQHANCFTVGGSLAVNAHGPDNTYAMMIDAVESFDILLADGTSVCVSKSHNHELFNAVIGGYGLLGIITSVTLKLTDNCTLFKKVTVIPTKYYLNELVQLRARGTSMHYAYLSVDSKGLFDKACVVTLSTAMNKCDYALFTRKNHHISLLHTLWSKSNFVKALHFKALPLFTERSGLISRNNAMRYAPTEFKFDDQSYCNILQEYFVPLSFFYTFLDAVKCLVKNYNINVLTAIVRYLPKNTQSVLSYAKEDSVSIVFLFNHARTKCAFDKARLWTQHLIDKVLECQGSFYLVAYAHARKDQIQKAYPRLKEFLALKQKYDPQHLFSNTLYKTYMQ